MARPEQIVLGTMRFSPSESPQYYAHFLAEAYARGIRTLHCSSEYDSFEILTAALARLRQERPEMEFQHIVKLAEPHFDEHGFDNRRLQEKIDKYRRALGVETIGIVQWMWRASLDADPSRIRDFKAVSEDIAAAVHNLKARRMVDRMMCFGYSVEFAEQAIHLAALDGILFYRNELEKEYDVLLDLLEGRSQSCIVVRPFSAGKTLEYDRPTPREQLDRSLDHPSVEAAILSTSNLEHLDSLIG